MFTVLESVERWKQQCFRRGSIGEEHRTESSALSARRLNEDTASHLARGLWNLDPQILRLASARRAWRRGIGNKLELSVAHCVRELCVLMYAVCEVGLCRLRRMVSL